MVVQQGAFEITTNYRNDYHNNFHSKSFIQTLNMMKINLQSNRTEHLNAIYVNFLPYKPTYREIFDSAYIHTECVLIYVLGKLNSIGTGGSRRMAADRWEPKALWSDFALVDVNANYFTITNPRRAGLRSGVQEGATSLLTCNCRVNGSKAWNQTKLVYRPSSIARTRRSGKTFTRAERSHSKDCDRQGSRPYVANERENFNSPEIYSGMDVIMAAVVSRSVSFGRFAIYNFECVISIRQ